MSESASAPKSSPALSLWRRLPDTLRALVSGFVVLIIGGGVSGALMFTNLATAPALPWFLPATFVWLWVLWRYLDGAAWPASTSQARRQALQARTLSARQWTWPMIAGSLAVAAVMGVAFVTYRHAAPPEAAYQAEFGVASYPWWTTASIFAALALTAGVVEEAAFRDYMLSGVQRRHGWLIAIVVVSLAFYVAHLLCDACVRALLSASRPGVRSARVGDALYSPGRRVAHAVGRYCAADAVRHCSIGGPMGFRWRRLEELGGWRSP